MRLIDADDLHEIEPSVLCSRDYMRGYNDSVREAKTAPTVDAVPIRHAHWEWDRKHEFYRCSDCKKHPGTWWVCNQMIDPRSCSQSSYCPNCGAKMDLKEDGHATET